MLVAQTRSCWILYSEPASAGFVGESGRLRPVDKRPAPTNHVPNSHSAMLFMSNGVRCYSAGILDGWGADLCNAVILTDGDLGDVLVGLLLL